MAAGEQHAGPVAAENHASQKQHQALAHGVDRAVGGLLQNEDGFEEAMQRVDGVRKAQMAERVGEEQVTEVVRAGWRRGREARQQREPQQNRQQRQDGHRPAGARRQLLHCRRQPPGGERQHDQQGRQGEFDEIARAEPERVVERQKRAEHVEQEHRESTVIARAARRLARRSRTIHPHSVSPRIGVSWKVWGDAYRRVLCAGQRQLGECRAGGHRKDANFAGCRAEHEGPRQTAGRHR